MKGAIRMRSFQAIKYWLFAALFALVLIGLALQSYPLLVALVIIAIALGIVADKMESKPTEQFRDYNGKHHRLHQ